MSGRIVASLLLLAICAPPAARAQPPPGLAPGATYHRIFVTEQAYGITSDPSLPPPAGKINGLDGADWNVTFQAWAAGLFTPEQEAAWLDSGTTLAVYKALLSTVDVDANTRMAIEGPVYNTQDEKLADDAADFWDGSLDAAVRYDAEGDVVSTNEVWTGNTSSGNYSGNACGCWTDSSGVGEKGNAVSSAVFWASNGFQSCSNTARLYGISPALTVPLPGDHNADDQVDAADYVVWRSDPAAHGDAQGYTDWAAHFGQSVGAASRAARPPRLGGPTSAVPEPCPLALLPFAALLLMNRRVRSPVGWVSCAAKTHLLIAPPGDGLPLGGQAIPGAPPSASTVRSGRPPRLIPIRLVY